MLVDNFGKYAKLIIKCIYIVEMDLQPIKHIIKVLGKSNFDNNMGVWDSKSR